ncbi:uncharacterized protein LOC122630645 isoform X4 [Vespula pensylvanica]|uniref:uncharacterized protein LOC122630645 isoform X4 n=1 Tax=Vespula pensylvanica TaxID=30213 RepID=UPI001CB9FFB3|nr:uncharacterized protein LOC122630645 isoform X4 [Vespula pensylvanica]
MSTSKSSSLLRLNQESRHITDDWQTRETDSEISDNDFITKGAFLLTPSHDFNIEKAAAICEKMNFRNTDDYHAVYKKGFHKITGARFYKKIAIPCRPAKTFTVYVLDVPEELPEDDIRHALFKYRSIVEVTRVPLATGTVLKAINDRLKNEAQTVNEPATIYTGPPVIRVTLASLEETTILLSQGLDFYGATYFPTDTPFTSSQSLVKYKSNRLINYICVSAKISYLIFSKYLFILDGMNFHQSILAKELEIYYQSLIILASIRFHHLRVV